MNVRSDMYISESLNKKLNDEARKFNTSRNAIINKILIQYFGNDEEMQTVRHIYKMREE